MVISYVPGKTIYSTSDVDLLRAVTVKMMHFQQLLWLISYNQEMRVRAKWNNNT